MNNGVEGRLTFVAAESFANRLRGLGLDGTVDYALSILSGHAPSIPAANWASIGCAICRGGLFSIEASCPAWNASLRFHPEKIEFGDYRIQHLRPARADSGAIESVFALAGQPKAELPSEIQAYSLAFRIITFAKPRGGRLVWLCGFSGHTDINLSDLEESA